MFWVLLPYAALLIVLASVAVSLMRHDDDEDDW